MSDNKPLVGAILNFIASEIGSHGVDEEKLESLEVAMQCLETAFDVSAAEYKEQPPLHCIFKRGMSTYEENFSKEQICDDRKAEAEECKNKGNVMVKQDKPIEALEEYSRAITLDPNNAVYYCNRAACYNRLLNFQAAVMDCKTALRLDSKYGKAYARCGLAYHQLKLYKEAVECFQKAVELEPDNQSYLTNLRNAQDVLEKIQAGGGPNIAESMQTGAAQLSNIFSNPELMNMAQQIISDPETRSMMNNVFAGNGVNILMQAGQVLAEEIQANHPHLLDNLRQAMNTGRQPPRNPPEGGNEPGEN